MQLPFQLKYAPPHADGYVGFWGPVTATIDWCEENYAISPYFAEFVNSITNLSFFFLSMFHLHSSVKNDLGPLYWFISIGMGVVGLGSWLFHMTLRYEFQLMDELPMIYVTALPFAHVFSWGKPEPWKTLIRVGTAVWTFGLTIIYCFFYKNPVLHQVSYGLLNFLIIYKTLATIRSTVTDGAARIFLYKLLGVSFAMFIFGFFIWNLDNIFCDWLIFARRKLNLPYSIFLEGHGWWHFFTSMGIYYFILYNQILSTWMKGRQDEYKLVWWGPLGTIKLKKNVKNE